MNRVVIESPYAARGGVTVAEHVHYAHTALRHSLDMSEAPFASHLVYPAVLDDTDPKQRAMGIQAGYEWMQSADIVAFYVDFGWSPGMIKALRVARIYGKRLEVRMIEPLPQSLVKLVYARRKMLSPEVEELLLDSGITEELPYLLPGVRAFRFKGRDE